MLDKKEAIKITSSHRDGSGPRYTYTFKCKEISCNEEIKTRSDYLKKATGFCKIHTARKRPFESIYNSLFNDHRKIQIDLTYKEFLKFTLIKECHYCDETIHWIEYPTLKGKYNSRAYYLDRKDHNLSYSINNCVTCCTRCNRMRSNKFTYDEFMLLTPGLKQIRFNRENILTNHLNGDIISK